MNFIIRVWSIFVLAILLFPVDGNARVIDEEIDLVDGLNKDMKLYHGYLTTLHFPFPTIQHDLGNEVDYTVHRSLDGKRISIQVSPWASPTNLNLTFPTVRVSLRLEVVKDRKLAKPMYRFRDPNANGKNQNPTTQTREFYEGAWVSDVVRVQTPIPKTWTGFGHTLTARPGIVQQSKTVTLMPFAVTNKGDYPFPVNKLELLNHQSRDLHAEVVQHSWMETANSDDKRFIEPGETAKFTLRVARPSRLVKGWLLRIVSSPAIQPATFDWTVRSTTPPQRSILQDRASFAVCILGGVAKLDNGTGLGPAQQAWTLTQGLRAWLSYGTDRHTSLDAALDIVRTSAAHIDTASVRATGGRLRLGGTIHTGRRLIPYARAGIGVQLARHSIEASQTDNDFRASALLYLGGGVHWLFAKRTMVGLSVLSDLPFGGDQTGPALELGINLRFLLDR